MSFIGPLKIAVPEIFRGAFLTALAALLLAACTSLPRVDAVESREQRVERLSALKGWELRGRVALRTEDNRGGQASLSWQYRDERHVIVLRGPLGGGLLRLQQDRDGAHLQDAERREYRAVSAEELLFNVAGWRIPIAGLEYWIRGLPAPSEIVLQEWDEYGRLTRLQQFGWDVYFLDYASSEGYELPSRLDVILPSPNRSARTEARIIIEEWVVK